MQLKIIKIKFRRYHYKARGKLKISTSTASHYSSAAFETGDARAYDYSRSSSYTTNSKKFFLRKLYEITFLMQIM